MDSLFSVRMLHQMENITQELTANTRILKTKPKLHHFTALEGRVRQLIEAVKLPIGELIRNHECW